MNLVADTVEGRETDAAFLGFMDKGKPPCDYERQLLSQQFLRVKTILSGKVVPPYEVEIQPSSTCNVKCEHCFGKCYERLPNKMGAGELRHIARELNDFRENGYKVEVAKFCGTTGEPLVNPVTAEGIEMFRGYGKKVILFTNGLLLGKYASSVVHADKVNLSFDAASTLTFRDLKRVDGFDAVIKGLENLVDKKYEMGKGPKIVASFVIGQKNYHEVVKFAKLMKDVGVDNVLYRVDFTNVLGIAHLSGEIEHNIHTAEELSDESFKVVPVYEDKNIEGEDVSAFSSDGLKCFNHNFWACIGSDCELYVCGHRTHGGVKSFGSLLEHSLRDLWSSAGRLESTGRLPDENCKFCSPSSSRRNRLMTFLSQLSPGKVDQLYKAHVFDG